MIEANAQLREREVVKLFTLASSLAGALERRGVDAGSARLAALFHGRAEAELSLSGQQRDRADDAFMHVHVDLARAALPEAAFADALREGREASLQEALRHASEWLVAARGPDPAPAARSGARSR